MVSHYSLFFVHRVKAHGRARIQNGAGHNIPKGAEEQGNVNSRAEGANRRRRTNEQGWTILWRWWWTAALKT